MSIKLAELPTIALGLNIEGYRPTLTLPKDCKWYNIVQAIDKPLNGITFDDIMTKQKLHHYPLIEQTVDNIDIEIWIASLVDIINEIKKHHTNLLVHIHQYTGTTILDKILHQKTGMTVILDQTNFFESPIDYQKQYPDIDGLLSLSQCAGLGVKAGQWIVPDKFYEFDVIENSICMTPKYVKNDILKFINFEYVVGSILVVNALWNPVMDDTIEIKLLS